MKTLLNKIIELGATDVKYKSIVRSLPKVEKELFDKNEEFFLIGLKKNKEKKQKEGDKVHAGKFKMSLKTYYELRNKATAILNSFHTGHSMGCYRTLKVNGVEFLNTHTLDTYSKSCSFKPTYGTIEINLTKKELLSIEIIGGIPTIITGISKESKKVKTCKILAGSGFKSNYKVTWKDCFITSDYHSDSVVEAIEWRKSQALRELKNRANQKLLAVKQRQFVGFQHSLLAGNCKAGTQAFAQRHGLDVNMGYSVEYLLSLENSLYVKRLLSL